MFDCTCNTQNSLLLNQHNGDDATQDHTVPSHMSSFCDYNYWQTLPSSHTKLPFLFISLDTIATSFHYHSSISLIFITFSARQSCCFHWKQVSNFNRLYSFSSDIHNMFFIKLMCPLCPSTMKRRRVVSGS